MTFMTFLTNFDFFDQFWPFWGHFWHLWVIFIKFCNEQLPFIEQYFIQFWHFMTFLTNFDLFGFIFDFFWVLVSADLLFSFNLTTKEVHMRTLSYKLINLVKVAIFDHVIKTEPSAAVRRHAYPQIAWKLNFRVVELDFLAWPALGL